ncbi:hypothetical protein [Nocardia sp. BMG111209]|uniref:NAD(P)H-dependent amine dehydrogenase family protein n=1 Tax=Nocardia sp. BMG111209 TaxID=1160137 RepID=UPI0003797D76|nr:hypothetical protein [Nocardia sp. BMG111209]
MTATTPEQAVSPRNLRVAQWATGTIGTHALRSVIEHPDMTLVGLRVYSDGKQGSDAGTLSGLDTVTGVTATADIETILAAKPDCVLYMPILCDPDDLCRLLAAGVNVVTTCGDFHNPGTMDPALRERVETACATGGTSVYSTGSSPGFITEALPLVLASVQRRLNHLTINEYADVSRRDSPIMIFDIMGFGRPAGAFDENMLGYIAGNFGPSLRLLAETLGRPLDSVESRGELATATHDVTVAAGKIEAGTVAGLRITVTGISGGRPLMTFTANWYCTTDLDQQWALRGDDGWHVHVDGDAPLDVDIRFPVAPDRLPAVSPGYTANRAVNAVAAVCAAAPGIRTTADLPHIVTTLA